MELTTTRTERVLTPALLAICLGYFLVILDSTIVNVALPTLHRDLHADLTALQWIVDGYLLTFAAGLLGGGALGDRLGARRVFQLGLGIFVLASAACGLAPTAAVLVAARAVQGIGAALAVPTSLSLLRAAHPARAYRARAVGVWGGVAGLAAAGGPILGGLLVDIPMLGWRLVFFVNVPLGLIAMLLTARRVAAPDRVPGTTMDLPGQLTGAVTLAALAYALIEGGRSGATTTTTVVAAGSLAAGTAFVLLQRLSPTPMLDLRLFRSATFSGGIAVGLLINLGFYGEMFVLNLYFQQDRHESPLIAGLALLPQMGVVALGSALSGRFTGRVGNPRPTMIIGLSVGAAGLCGLACCIGLPYPLLLPALVAAGFGMSFTMPAATTAVVDAAPANRAGAAAGAINTARQVGSVIGIAVLGALAGGPVAGPRIALFAAAAAFLLGAAITITSTTSVAAPTG